ncbi:MAG TPA: tetratricopeptide repeat protein [Solirubrobacteraceae bacterium]|nr:tetratricopeptide repeat protein [Solirubrobacteraceae bacterium]
MSAAESSPNRQVIPRWRSLEATAHHGELGSAGADRGARALQPTVGLHERAREFREQRSLSFAADLLAASLVLGPTAETTEAAQLIVAAPAASAMLRRAATWALERRDRVPDETDSPETDGQRVRALRQGLRNNPRNALRWAELSRHHINQGHERKAQMAMRIAINIAPYDRYVLRSSVRLWTHLKDPEQAVRSLTHARDLVRRDPWLLASEIAATATAEKQSRNIKQGRMVAEDAVHSPFALSELASALATIELQAGGVKKARRLFRSAMINPNENSVAQAEWASSRLAGDLGLRDDQIERSAEARARRFAEQDQLDPALAAGWEWLTDQPFSTEPATFGSYHASMCGSFDRAIEFAEAGLQPNPGNALLLNNLAFSQANLGRLDAAAATLARVRPSEEGWTRPTLTATRGFLAFRCGEFEKGRDLYRKAIDTMPDSEHRLRATLMLASEEARVGGPGGQQVAELLAAISRLENPQLKIWAKHLARRTAGRRGRA